MKIATGYIPPTSGTVTVEGFDVVNSPLDVQKSVGYLPEHNPLYLDMYVHEYLEFIGGIHGLKGKLLKDRVNEMVSLVGLTREQNKKIGMLSKGYRQRVGLAQALIHNPPVLILDEPTTGLDPNQIVEIRNLIKSISKDKTVIFSTHIMQEVQALCDRVVIVNLGKKVADSKVSDLHQMHRKETVLVVDFDKYIAVDEFLKIDGILRIETLSEKKYKFVCGEKDVRGDIFNIASANGWTLLGLKQEESSLESIFQDLTRKKD
jgi:ABC-2 type transport system ATP-binding protein